MAGYFEKVLWDTHLEAVKKVAGKPGYDLNGDRIRIGSLVFSTGDSSPIFDKDWRVQQKAVKEFFKIPVLKGLEGQTVSKHVKLDGSHAFMTTCGIYVIQLVNPSYEESAYIASGPYGWEHLKALELLPYNLVKRVELEAHCINVWDNFADRRDQVIDCVHKIRGCGDKDPLPLSMRCVYEQYGTPENLW